jgi:D-3-phosphoglycerate dehydrogenase
MIQEQAARAATATGTEDPCRGTHYPLAVLKRGGAGKGGHMAPRKIVFTDYYYENIEQEKQILGKLSDYEIIDCTSIVPGGIKDEDSILEYASDADAIVVQFAQMTKKVIGGLKRCKIISRYAIGVDTIDTAAAREKGIVIANVPDYCIEEVSDTAVAHILNCVRKTAQANGLIHSRSWAYDKIKPIRRFGSLTIGLIAFGNIARRVAEKLRPFGNRILAYDPYFSDKAKFPWVEFLPLEELLPRADIVSVHAPLNSDSYHLLDSRRLSMLKKGSIVVNTSRGGLVDEAALAEAIESGTVAAAGLDVLEYPDEDYVKSILIKYSDRVFITPHIGWYSEESIRDLQRKTALNVYEMLTKGKPLYRVDR